VTALRDNPVAIAEGAAGAPRVQGVARVHNRLGFASVASPVTALTITDLEPSSEVIIIMDGFLRGSDTVGVRMEASVNNGASWVVVSSGVALSGLAFSRGISRVFLPSITTRGFRITSEPTTSNPPGDIHFQIAPLEGISGQINAVRVNRSSGEGSMVEGTLSVYAATRGYHDA
jgi:hypothetical protein